MEFVSIFDDHLGEISSPETFYRRKVDRSRRKESQVPTPPSINQFGYCPFQISLDSS